MQRGIAGNQNRAAENRLDLLEVQVLVGLQMLCHLGVYSKLDVLPVNQTAKLDCFLKDLADYRAGRLDWQSVDRGAGSSRDRIARRSRRLGHGRRQRERDRGQLAGAGRQLRIQVV